MTANLRLVTDENVAEITPESLRVPPAAQTPEQIADLEWIARHILTGGDLALAELRNALGNRDQDASIGACRRLLAVGLLAGDHARHMERRS